MSAGMGCGAACCSRSRTVRPTGCRPVSSWSCCARHGTASSWQSWACQSGAATAAETLRWLGLDVQAEMLEQQAEIRGSGAPGAAATGLARGPVGELDTAVLALRYPVADDFAVALTREPYPRYCTGASPWMSPSGTRFPARPGTGPLRGGPRCLQRPRPSSAVALSGSPSLRRTGSRSSTRMRSPRRGAGASETARTRRAATANTVQLRARLAAVVLAAAGRAGVAVCGWACRLSLNSRLGAAGRAGAGAWPTSGTARVGTACAASGRRGRGSAGPVSSRRGRGAAGCLGSSCTAAGGVGEGWKVTHPEAARSAARSGAGTSGAYRHPSRSQAPGRL